MIKENEVVDLIGEVIPGINHAFEKTAGPLNLYRAVYCFAHFTTQLLASGRLTEARACFRLADRLWAEGSRQVKNTIENVYLFSVSTAIDSGLSKSIELKAVLCPELLQEYKRQTGSCN